MQGAHKFVLKNYDKLLLAFFLLGFIAFFLENSLFYSFDSNESFSSLWHSYSLLNYDFSLHKGLADEAFSPASEAHSFVHTHQGNVPRLLGAILIKIGFASIQSHIIITFLLLGMPALYFCIRLLEDLSKSKLYTFITTIFLITNFALFFQWTFVTYRIWYFYLFITSIYFLLNVDKRFIFKPLLFFNLICIFYFEFIFALFMSCILSGIALSANNFSIITTIKKYWVFILAPIISLSILGLQLTYYYGFDSLVLDLEYTFLARNVKGTYSSDMLDFYTKNNIIFWHNFFSYKDGILNIVFYNDIKFYGILFFSYFCYSLLIPIKIYSSELKTIILSNIVVCFIWSIVSRFIMPRSLNSKLKSIGSSFMGSKYLTIILLILNNYLVVSIFDNSNANFFHLISSYRFILSLLLFIPLLQHALRLKKISSTNHFLIYVNVIGLLIYQVNNHVIPSHFDTNVLGSFSSSILIILYIYFIITFYELNSASLKLKLKFRSLFLLVGILMAALLFIIYLSPGYMWTGYVTRAAPFIIFVKFLIYGFSLYYSTILFMYLFKSKSIFTQYLSASLASTFIVLWIFIQYSTIQYFGINNYSFLDEIIKKRFQNQSFISNIYPASYTQISNSWGFQDSSLHLGTVITVNGVRYLTASNDLLWFKDRANDKYKRPRFLICYNYQSIAGKNINRSNICNNYDLIKEIDNYDFVRIDSYELMATKPNAYKWVILEFDYSKNFEGLYFESK